jgi:hypothetical protein
MAAGGAFITSSMVSNDQEMMAFFDHHQCPRHDAERLAYYHNEFLSKKGNAPVVSLTCGLDREENFIWMTSEVDAEPRFHQTRRVLRKSA